MSETFAIEDLLEQIADTQDRFVELMNARLPEAGRRELELYLALLSKLVAKLEKTDTTLRDAAQELFAEVAGLVMSELGR